MLLATEVNLHDLIFKMLWHNCHFRGADPQCKVRCMTTRQYCAINTFDHVITIQNPDFEYRTMLNIRPDQCCFFILFKRLLTPSLWKFRSKFVLMPSVFCNKNLQNKAWICEKYVKYTRKSRQFYILKESFYANFMSLLYQFYVNFIPKGHYEFATIFLNMGLTPHPSFEQC